MNILFEYTGYIIMFSLLVSRKYERDRHVIGWDYHSTSSNIFNNDSEILHDMIFYELYLFCQPKLD